MSSLYFYYSTMNAGKSSGLLQSNYNYIERGMNTLVMKPGIDTRDGASVVKSRLGLEVPCYMFGPEEDLFALVGKKIESEKLHCVFLDEAQFMSPEQVDQLSDIVDILDVPVLAYGLRSDFQGNLFPGSQRLMTIADKLKEVRTICWCGKLANMVLRLDGNGNVVKEGSQIVIGGNDQYVSVCRRHFKLNDPDGK